MPSNNKMKQIGVYFTSEILLHVEFYHFWFCVPPDSGRGVARAVGQRPWWFLPGSSGRESGRPWRSRPNSGCLRRTWCFLRGRWSTPERCWLSSSRGWYACTTDLLRQRPSLLHSTSGICVNRVTQVGHDGQRSSDVIEQYSMTSDLKALFFYLKSKFPFIHWVDQNIVFLNCSLNALDDVDGHQPWIPSSPGVDVCL